MWLLTVPGCVLVGPDYIPPQNQTPANWSSPVFGDSNETPAASVDPQQLAQWWQHLNDPLLTELINAAANNNWDLQEAQQRVREARARRGIAAADRWPTLSASSSVSQSRVDPPDSPATHGKLYDASLDARWELGLFGDRRRALEAASADAEASQEEHTDLLISVLAEVALNYVDLRSLQSRLIITRKNLASQTETLDIARWRHLAGLTTQVDVEQARQNLEQTRAQIPALLTARQQAINRLSTLIGGYPGDLTDRLSAVEPIPIADLQIAVGVPADTLRQRPDIRAAERRLAAQTARVGVATAARYPDMSLIGSVGVETLSSRQLFDAKTLFTSAIADLGITLFDAGRIRRNIEVQTASQAQALARYESTVRLALEEVENAMVAYLQEQQRRSSLQSATDAAKLAAELILSQYQSGLVDFQRVLDAERSLLTLQDQLATSKGQITATLIRLYKALGGGWTPTRADQPEAGTNPGTTAEAS